MPLPKPGAKESESDFISRFMSDEKARSEYPDKDKRLAVAHSMMGRASKSTYVKLAGVDEGLGLVFGFAIVCKEAGKDYFDLQGDHIPEDAMLKAAAGFAESRQAGAMHERAAGAVPFLFPLTDEIAKAFEIECPRRGLMIAVRADADMLAKFRDGTYTGFSIGGRRLLDVEVD